MGGLRVEWRRLSSNRVHVGVAILLTTWAGTAMAASDPTVVLRENPRAGDSTRVQIELKAQGLYRPGLPPGPTPKDGRMPKPLSVEIETRFIFHERIVSAEVAGKRAASARDADGASTNQRVDSTGGFRAVRHVIQAASTINGEVRPTSALIRPEVCLLVAERREIDGPVVVVSPAGALTWSELELVQGLGDPLVLADLLPEKAVQAGDAWRVRDVGAKALSGYDLLSSNKLDAVLESVDSGRARLRLQGQIQGSALGGSGTMTFDGFFLFDRQKARIDQLELNRAEIRQPGPIEAGLDLKSTLRVTREAAVPPATLTDGALANVDLDVTPGRELLRLTAPGGRAVILHDRRWHLFWQDRRLTVLKRLDSGQVIAQCNLAVGPAAGKGRHQDPNQFRDDVRRAVQSRFVQFLGAGEVDGDPAGGFRYKVGVQGREGDLGVVWYYYLLASPAGEQLLATFTLARDHVKAFADQDVHMIGSLRWQDGSRQ
jgi:hypothetical protein